MIAKLREFEGRDNYPYDAVFLHGAISDNQLLTPRLAEVVKEWNDRYEFPKLILSRNAEFFQYIEKHYGDRLPVVRGSAGTYWEDGAGSSARETTLSRNAHEQVANGEKLLALAQRIGGQVPPHQPDDIYQVWRNCLLYDEHTWGAIARSASRTVPSPRPNGRSRPNSPSMRPMGPRRLLDQGTNSPDFARPMRRTGPASSSTRRVGRGPTSCASTCRKNTALAPERLNRCDASPDGTRSCWSKMCRRAAIASCDWRRRRRPFDPEMQSDTATAIESRFYRVEFDPAGGIASIRDKELDRELVDPQAPYRLNQYVYVAGGKGTRIVMDPNGPAAATEDQPGTNAGQAAPHAASRSRRR